MSTLSARDRLIFPLDVSSIGEARRYVSLLRDDVGMFKIGLELFTSIGPDAVRLVHEAGAACFLDLKLHDIGETVVRTVGAAASLGVRFLTLHATNGACTLAHAVEATQGTGTTLLAVTVLTNLTDADLIELGLADSTGRAVDRLARLSVAAGVRGLVCSPHECTSLRAALGPSASGNGPWLVVPGVRPMGTATNDQARVATPREAIRDGADYLVVGRPIRDAVDPRNAARAIVAEIQEALETL